MINCKKLVRWQDKIKALREEYNLSTKTIAEFLGMEEREYVAVENGGETISVEKLDMLCSLYGITIPDFENCKLNSRIPSLKKANLDKQDISLLKALSSLSKVLLSEDFMINIIEKVNKEKR